MKNELEYFRVGNAWGGYQEWFHDPMMRLGGCAAVTACDSCIYFDLHYGTRLYPYSLQNITKRDYVRFGMKMKPYLRPRWHGIDRLDIYIDGFGEYLSEQGCGTVLMEGFSGENPCLRAQEVLRQQIDSGLPVPCLTLHHTNPAFRDYDWHWFLLTGYELRNDQCMVKIITYGSARWLDFESLWDTGASPKGGLIRYRLA